MTKVGNPIRWKATQPSTRLEQSSNSDSNPQVPRIQSTPSALIQSAQFQTWVFGLISEQMECRIGAMMVMMPEASVCKTVLQTEKSAKHLHQHQVRQASSMFFYPSQESNNLGSQSLRILQCNHRT